MKKILYQIIGTILGGLLLIILVSIPFYDLYKESFSIYLFLFHLLVVICIFLGTLATLFVILFSKRTDMRLAKRSAHFGKPYLIKIDQNGGIEAVNSACLVNLKDIGKYASVEEFDYNREYLDLMNEIRKERAFTVRFRNLDNEEIHLRFLPVKSGKKFYLVGENISAQQLNFEFHRNLSLYNPITKYPNRNYFGIKLQELFDNPRELKKANVLALVDISGFRNIHKLFGSIVANETLKALANIIEESIWGYRAEVFHMRDDIFLVFFRNAARKAAETWARAFLEDLRSPVAIAGNHFNIEVNIGIFPIEINKYPDLHPVGAYENVTHALNRAKNSKKTNLVVFEEGFPPTAILDTDVREALKNGELRLYFQPQFNNLTNEIVGFEGLLRWENPKYKFWSPADFFEVMSENKLVIDVGKLVLEETLRFAQEVAPHGIQVACNLSPFQLLHEGFVSELLAFYDEYELKPKQICLEVAEAYFLENNPEIHAHLSALKNKGYAIRLDNFGSGYASMLYLKEFPVDGISINRDFIRSLLSDKYSRKNVLNILGLAKSLDLEVVAEGVESEEQNQFLRENGCHIVQGYLYGRALPREDALAFIKNHREE